MTMTESQIERDFIAKLEALKYSYRPDIHDEASLEANSWHVTRSPCLYWNPKPPLLNSHD